MAATADSLTIRIVEEHGGALYFRIGWRDTLQPVFDYFASVLADPDQGAGSLVPLGTPFTVAQRAVRLWPFQPPGPGGPRRRVVVCFSLDGNEIFGNTTAIDLDLEDGDQIDCVRPSRILHIHHAVLPANPPRSGGVGSPPYTGEPDKIGVLLSTPLLDSLRCYAELSRYIDPDNVFFRQLGSDRDIVAGDTAASLGLPAEASILIFNSRDDELLALDVSGPLPQPSPFLIPPPEPKPKIHLTTQVVQEQVLPKEVIVHILEFCPFKKVHTTMKLVSQLFLSSARMALTVGRWKPVKYLALQVSEPAAYNSSMREAWTVEPAEVLNICCTRKFLDSCPGHPWESLAASVLTNVEHDPHEQLGHIVAHCEEAFRFTYALALMVTRTYTYELDDLELFTEELALLRSSLDDAEVPIISIIDEWMNLLTHECGISSIEYGSDWDNMSYAESLPSVEVDENNRRAEWALGELARGLEQWENPKAAAEFMKLIIKSIGNSDETDHRVALELSDGWEDRAKAGEFVDAASPISTASLEAAVREVEGTLRLRASRRDPNMEDDFYYLCQVAEMSETPGDFQSY